MSFYLQGVEERERRAREAWRLHNAEQAERVAHARRVARLSAAINDDEIAERRELMREVGRVCLNFQRYLDRPLNIEDIEAAMKEYER